jgi:hypothetical protein
MRERRDHHNKGEGIKKEEKKPDVVTNHSLGVARGNEKQEERKVEVEKSERPKGSPNGGAFLSFLPSSLACRDVGNVPFVGQKSR